MLNQLQIAHDTAPAICQQVVYDRRLQLIYRQLAKKTSDQIVKTVTDHNARARWRMQ
jgi:hypothetical protein